MCSHEMLGLGPLGQLLGIEARKRGQKSPMTPQKRIGELDHE
jgi:hypothetical protein